jgi:hypothetical protein
MRIANRMALFLWGFAAVWLAMLTAFTALVIRDGPPPGYAPEVAIAILAAFWLGGFGLAGYAASQPLQSVTRGPDGAVRVDWIRPLRRERRVYPAGTVGAPEVVVGTDTDGDPYFRARLRLPDGLSVDIAEGHDRARCEDACRRFIAGGA